MIFPYKINFKLIDCSYYIYLMQKTIYEQLKSTEAYCRTLQDSFKNNLQVIEERQNEICQLSQQISGLKQQNGVLIRKCEEQQSSNELSIRLIRNDYLQKMQQKQIQMQELTTMIQNKMRKQLQSITQRLSQDLKSTKNQLLDRDQTNRRLLHQNSRLTEIIKEQKNSLLEMESQITVLNDEKNSMSNKMALHQQQLQGIKTCNSSWQDMLKDKLKQAQKERQALEEEFSDYKLTVKEKLKKQKDDLNKKILQLSEEKQNQIRQIAHQHKQLKYRIDKIQNQNRDYQKQLEHVRDEKNKLETTLSKYKQNELKSNFQKNQKQYEYLLKIFEQDKRDLKNQIQVILQQKKSIKQQLDQANSKREAGQKAVQRLRVQLTNKSKESDEFKKQNKKLRYQFQAKLKEYEAYNKEGMMNSKPANSKGFQHLKIENDYSKVFTQDMGEIDDKFFQPSSALRSPKNNQKMGFSQNREAQLMKKISQLQLELQQYKNLIKKLKDETQNLKKITDQDKNRQVSLYRDKANIYWQKANDKEQQVMSLRQQYNQLKSNYTELAAELKRYKEYQHQNIARQQQLEKTRELNRLLQQKKRQIQQQLQIVTKQRDLLEQMSSELRAENHSLREHINPGHSVDQNNTNQIQNQTHISQLPQEEQTIPYYDNPPQRQRIPKKLHDLVRQKKMLSVSGKRAAIEERMAETRLEHIGTDSQKEVLEKIKIKNKTPPKIANYAQMKKEKQRRTSSKLQTLSQKQVYQRLKARQNRPLSPQKPEKGINYLQLRDLQGLN